MAGDIIGLLLLFGFVGCAGALFLILIAEAQDARREGVYGDVIELPREAKAPAQRVRAGDGRSQRAGAVTGHVRTHDGDGK